MADISVVELTSDFFSAFLYASIHGHKDHKDSVTTLPISHLKLYHKCKQVYC